jgi:hypothetical protein
LASNQGREIGAGKARPTDRLELFRFRYRVYVAEQRLSPSGADHVARTLEDDLDRCSASYALWNGSGVVGSSRVTYLADVPDAAALVAKFRMDPALAAFGPSALCTSSRFMFTIRFAASKGMFRLMAAAYRDAAARGVRLIYGDCSPSLLSFYLHLGYRTYSSPWYDTSYGWKVPLLMLGRDHQWLQHCRSPLATLAAGYPEDLEARGWFERTYGRAARPRPHQADREARVAHAAGPQKSSPARTEKP